MNILVIGGSGLLGLRITRRARRAGHRVTATYQASTPPADVTALTMGVRPGAIINAAYRQPDWEATADSTRTQARLTTRLRGAREFLAPASA